MIQIHMEGIKGCGGGGGGRVNIGEDDSIDGMQCIDHPYRNNPGGICAFCLQEKLGKLVSSSFPLSIHASVSSSSSPSFRSDIIAPSSSSTSTARHCPSSSSSINTISSTTVVPSSSSSLSLSVIPTRTENHYHHEYYSRKTRIPFLLAKRKKKKTSVSNSVSNSVYGSGSATSNIILKRSKSTATPRRGNNSLVDADDEYFSPRKRNGFWSFLYLSSKSSTSTKSFRDGNNASAASKLKEKCCSGSSLGRKNDIVIVEEEEEEEDKSPNSNNNNNNTGSSYGRKVSRSRSVGCGSRSFSGDFFERISTGFGDCTLRRVESQREGKSKVVSNSTGIASSVNHAQEHHHHCMKERVLRRCGGIFSGFMMTSSSSSNSSSNSSYWVSSNSTDDAVNGGGKQGSVSISQNNRSGKSWGWAFASPMRAFSSKGSSSKENHHNKRDIIRDANDKINATPNLSAMPSLLAARG